MVISKDEVNPIIRFFRSRSKEEGYNGKVRIGDIMSEFARKTEEKTLQETVGDGYFDQVPGTVKTEEGFAYKTFGKKNPLDVRNVDTVSDDTRDLFNAEPAVEKVFMGDFLDLMETGKGSGKISACNEHGLVDPDNIYYHNEYNGVLIEMTYPAKKVGYKNITFMPENAPEQNLAYIVNTEEDKTGRKSRKGQFVLLDNDGNITERYNNRFIAAEEFCQKYNEQLERSSNLKYDDYNLLMLKAKKEALAVIIGALPQIIPEDKEMWFYCNDIVPIYDSKQRTTYPETIEKELVEYRKYCLEMENDIFNFSIPYFSKLCYPKDKAIKYVLADTLYDIREGMKISEATGARFNLSAFKEISAEYDNTDEQARLKLFYDASQKKEDNCRGQVKMVLPSQDTPESELVAQMEIVPRKNEQFNYDIRFKDRKSFDSFMTHPKIFMAEMAEYIAFSPIEGVDRHLLHTLPDKAFGKKDIKFDMNLKSLITYEKHSYKDNLKAFADMEIGIKSDKITRETGVVCISDVVETEKTYDFTGRYGEELKSWGDASPSSDSRLIHDIMDGCYSPQQIEMLQKMFTYPLQVSEKKVLSKVNKEDSFDDRTKDGNSVFSGYTEPLPFIKAAENPLQDAQVRLFLNQNIDKAAKQISNRTEASKRLTQAFIEADNKFQQAKEKLKGQVAEKQTEKTFLTEITVEKTAEKDKQNSSVKKEKSTKLRT